ncbi:terpene synthase family protein [Actinomadura nitritigenes]|uniref:terpene synthase family protein n=1 Tax=Actinomadura nitritigenes TaxID=134602 RepID=UPI003D8C2D38
MTAGVRPAASGSGGPAIRVDLPPRYCPWPAVRHPDETSLALGTQAWIDGFAIPLTAQQRTRMRGNDCPGFYGRIMPAAPTDRLQLAVDWCTLMSLFDDAQCDEGPASTDPHQFSNLAAGILRTLETPHGDPCTLRGLFDAPVHDLARRTRKWATPVQGRRSVEGHRAWFFGVLWEFAHRKAGRTPTLNDYAHMRRHTAAGAATLAFTEIIDGEEIPPEEMESPAVRALAEIATITTAAFDDDLFSYGKEMWQAARTGPSLCRLHLPDILRVEHDLAPEEALERATELCNRLTLRFLQLRDQVLPGASRPLRRYIEHLTHLIPGDLEWGLKAGRYTNPDGCHPGAVATRAAFLAGRRGRAWPLAGNCPQPRSAGLMALAMTW